MQFLHEVVLLPCILRAKEGTDSYANLKYLMRVVSQNCIVLDSPKGILAKTIGDYANSGQLHCSMMVRKFIEKLKIEGRYLMTLNDTDIDSSIIDCYLYHLNSDIFSSKTPVFSICQKPRDGIPSAVPKSSIKLKIRNKYGYRIELKDLFESGWDPSMQNSMRIRRHSSNYIPAIKNLLRASRSVSIIDPYFDPSHPDYSGAKQLIDECNQSNVCTEVNIHRVYHKGRESIRSNDPLFRPPDRAEWENLFRNELSIYTSALKISVFIWPEFHDRYILTNLMGLSLPYGISTTTDPTEITGTTTWSRLSASDNERLQNTVFVMNSQNGNQQNRYFFRV